MAAAFEPKKIDEASPTELRDYAGTFLGIPVDGATDGEVLAKVRAANDGDTIFVRNAVVATDQTGSPPPDVENKADGTALAGGLGRDDPKVTLTIHAEERDGVVNNHHKEIGVNGRVWLLKRGQSIDIPYRVYLALNAACRTSITHDPSTGNVIEQQVMNTPFNIEKMPSKEQIAEWHARTDAAFAPN